MERLLWATSRPRTADHQTTRSLVPQITRSDSAKRFGVHANQIYKWKREFIQRAAFAFERDVAAASSGGSTEREDELLKKIGELTVERDFLARGLERRR